MKVIEALWMDYRKKVMPRDCHPTQVEETMKAFFAGAMGLFSTVVGSLDEGEEPTERDLAFMDSIAEELKEFAGRADA